MKAVSLEDLEGVLESVEYDPMGEGPKGYVQRSTGQTFVFLSAELACARGEEPIEDLPEWQQELVADAEKMVKNPEDFVWLEPRTQSEVYEVMKGFCDSQKDQHLREDLLDCISGRGAFSRFQRGLAQYELQEEWYVWRQAAIRNYLRAWCEENALACFSERKEAGTCATTSH